jgi:hypothetical protein
MPDNLKLAASSTKGRGAGFGLLLLLLALALLLLLRQDCLPGQTLFSNDGPLGRLMTQCHRLPERFTGCWNDLNSVGANEGGVSPNISFGLQWLLKPILFSKLYVPIALLILGFAAWCFFQQSGLAPPACLLGGLAAGLNSGFFSTACWGVAAHPLTFAMGFLAMAALADTTSPRRWLRTVLAGLAVGMGISEGADVGAILSLYVAAFVMYQGWIAEGPRAKNAVLGTTRVAVVAAVAALLAAQAISTLVSTNIRGVAGTQQDTRTRAERWDWATQWSLPKKEALGLVVPGLFGYRFDTPEGGIYWGTIGRAPEWDRYVANGQQGPAPTGFTRYSGAGYYAGVAVLLLALWAATQLMRPKDSIFSRAQRGWIWFWLAAGIVSLLLAFGRYAPFYRWFYALPYLSTIRNPIKFLHLANFSLIILFAYGVDGLWRKYMKPASPGYAPRWPGLLGWWAKAGRFEKRWVQGCGLALALSLAAWAVYALSRQSVQEYLPTVQVAESDAPQVAGFSIWQVGWFELFFALTAGLLALILSGAFAGARAAWGAALLGLLMTMDLARADQPWVACWDYEQKYASNPIIDILRQKPYEHRVAMLSFALPPNLVLLEQLYRLEWAQHLFPYYNIQSYDVVDMPRKPEDIAAFEKAFTPHGQADLPRLVARCWQLTGTRYFLGATDYEETMNKQVDPVQRRLRAAARFRIVPKPGIAQAVKLQELTTVLADNGPFALFEFSGALPRANLYTRWQAVTNNQAALDLLVDPAFDPRQSVLVAGELPASPPDSTNQDAGHVEFASYAPKAIVLESDASAPAVLLLNDHFDPNWKVRVDGRAGTLLRCNYFMRGVYLEPGRHTVEFRFQPPIGPLLVSLGTLGAGLLALGFCVLAERRDRSQVLAPAPRPSPPQKSDRGRPRQKAVKN